MLTSSALLISLTDQRAAQRLKHYDGRGEASCGSMWWQVKVAEQGYSFTSIGKNDDYKYHSFTDIVTMALGPGKKGNDVYKDLKKQDYTFHICYMLEGFKPKSEAGHFECNHATPFLMYYPSASIPNMPEVWIECFGADEDGNSKLDLGCWNPVFVC